MRIIKMTALAATIMMGMTLPAFGGEGNVNGKSGKKYRIKGYGHSSQEAYHPRSVILTINRAIFTKKKKWKKKKITHREYHCLAKHLNYSTRLWENVPTSRIRFGMSYITPVMEVNEDGDPKHWGSEVKRNMVTLNGALGSAAGHCQKVPEVYIENAGKSYGFKDSSDGFEEYPHFGICIDRLANDFKQIRKGDSQWVKMAYAGLEEIYSPGFWKKRARVMVTHEVGHGIGFAHSALNNLALAGRALRKCQSSVMSYSNDILDEIMDGKSIWQKFTLIRLIKKRIKSRVLNAGDVAVVSRLYPDFRNPLSRTTGTVRGIVVDGAGKKELYGANVFLVRRGVGMLSRISGYESSMPEAEIAVRNGDFVLNGVPPGTYDLLVASWVDKRIFKMGIAIDYSSEFDIDFKSAWVHGIRVRKGEDVNVGYVQAGARRTFVKPGLMDMGITFRAPKAGTYSVIVESKSKVVSWVRKFKKKIRHQYKVMHYGTVKVRRSGTQGYGFRLKPGKYLVTVRRIVGKRFQKIMFRKPFDLRASLVKAEWKRQKSTVDTFTRHGAKREKVEAWRYIFSGKTKAHEFAYAVHGKRAKMFVVESGSEYWFRLAADWGSDAKKVYLKRKRQKNRHPSIRYTIEVSGK